MRSTESLNINNDLMTELQLLAPLEPIMHTKYS